MQKTLFLGIAIIVSLFLALQPEAETPEANNTIDPPGEVVKKLEGSSWELVVDGTDKNSCQDLPPLMEFRSKQRVSGNLGCNLFNGSYQQDKKAFMFLEASATKRMCAPKMMEMEKRLTKVLEDTRYLTTMNKELLFWNDKGILIARYRPERFGACQ